jgi:nucleotide-binding universal stress UspA family protein
MKAPWRPHDSRYPFDRASDQADLIGMPTMGHHGFLDALRDNTTEWLLRQAPCPVLAAPVAMAAP